MRELWATIQADKRTAKHGEVNDDLFALLISGRISWRNPIICDRAIGEDACVEICRFTSATVEPKASS
jgi:hypothetical protein